MKGVLNTLSRWIGLGAKDAGRRKQAPRPARAARKTPPDVLEAGEIAEAAIPYTVAASMMTDVGCDRDVNEDSVQYIHPAESDGRAARGSLFIVADGMGGHAAGEVASRMAVETITRVYYESDQPPSDALEQAFHEANRAIYEAAQNGTRQGMGTTGTALVLQGNTAFYAHVGDSRLYLIRDGGIYLMSEDHSLVMEMVRNGMLTLEEARTHDDKNVILRALGTKPAVEVTTWSEPLRVGPGDRFLLCSDGLYDLVEDQEMLDTVTAAAPHAACEALIALAKERGGHDNITIGLIGLVEEEETPEAQADRPTRDLEILPGEDEIKPTREAQTFEE